MRDASAKGRTKPSGCKGEAHGEAKLSEADVTEIRSCSSSGVELARRFGVTATTISHIRLRKTWRHI